jgi:L-alanine-DL-glutamate epimerase-like enolase superfamily enzyme
MESLASRRFENIRPEVQLMIDCYSFFDVPLAISVARSLEPQNLALV